MTEVKSVEQLSLILSFLVPGLVVLYVRSQFLTGRMQAHKDALLSYFALSVMWWGLSLPVVSWALGSLPLTSERPGLWFLLTLGGPAVFGTLLGVNASKGWTRRLLGRFGLRLIHVMPTAWDWKFEGMPASWVLVTLKDGTRFAGFCGSDSFISSDPQERDMYIQRIYSLDAEERWVDQGDKGLLVRGSEIRSIEFWPYTDA